MQVARREWTAPLLGAAVIALLLGCGAALVRGEIEPWQHYFPEGPWRGVLFATGLLAGISLLLTLLTQTVKRKPVRSAVLYDGSRAGSAKEALSSLRDEWERLLAEPEPDVPQLLDEALRAALSIGASDLHLAQGATHATLTMRADGVLHRIHSFDSAVAARLVQRTKVLAKLDLSSMRPQDGGLERHLGEFILRARVSVLPAHHGERLVLRLVRGSDTLLMAEELGFSPEVAQALGEVLAKTQGVLYLSGPVGSGKTTTLYAALSSLHRTRGQTTSLVSLEDPIEQELSFVTQTAINSKVGLDFATALRTILRQDPGALMIGEVRDQETAEIVVQAGLTGHLILTTIHVQKAAATFARLIDMGLEPFLVADSCAGALAQRLVRLLCIHCRRAEAPSEQQLKGFSELGVELTQAQYFVGDGCERCDGQGYAGRRVVGEFLRATPEMRRAIAQGEHLDQLDALAQSQGMVPLARAATQLASQGETSLSEVLRVLS